MANQLHFRRYVREVLLKDGSVIKYKSNNEDLCYSELKEEVVEITDWKSLLRELDYVEDFNGTKNRKGRVWCYVMHTDTNCYHWDKKVYQDEFKSAKVYYENDIISTNSIRMRRLINELTADDFIRFLKDNELHYIGQF